MKIFVTKKILGNYLENFTKAGHEVKVNESGKTLTGEELLDGVKGVDAILSLLTDRIDADLMDAAGPQLKIVSNYAVGFDNVDIKEASNRGIVVTNTPCEEVNEAVAEHTWALILSLTRRVVESDEFIRDQGYFSGSGGYKGWEPDLFLGSTLKGKTLGIIGLGRIGSMVARRAKGYDMTVLYNKHNPDPEAEKELGVTFATLDELLSKSDIISLHVPLCDETRGMINASTIAKMKDGVYLVNTARGPIVVENDLVEALKNKKIKGVALDVFEHEPEVNPEFISFPNVIMTPHIASATIEARNKMGEEAVNSIINVLSDQKPTYIVNPEIWERRRK